MAGLRAHPGRILRRPPRFALLGLLAAALSGCSSDEEPTPEEHATTPADVVARDRAAGLFERTDYEAARRELQPLVERPDARADDLISAANVEFELGEYERAQELLERALPLAPDDPAIHWGLYRHARGLGDFEAALPHARRAAELAPDDYPTQLGLANTLAELDDQALHKEAEERYRELIAAGIDTGGSWYVSALFRFGRFLVEDGRMAEGEPYLTEHEAWKVKGFTVPSSQDLDRGTFGQVTVGERRHFGASPPAPPAALAEPRLLARGSFAGFAPARVDRGPPPGDPPPDRKDLLQVEQGVALQILAWGPAGLQVLDLTPEGARDARLVCDGVVEAVVPVDFEVPDKSGKGLSEDERLDLVLLRRAAADAPAELEVWRRDGGWERVDPALLAGLATLPAGALAAADYDHEGDVDLVVAHDGRVEVLRNDAFGLPGGAFTPETEAFRWPAGAWTTRPEDLDGDNDVDMVLFPAGPAGATGGGGAQFLRSERSAGFAPDAAALPALRSADGARIALADLDADGQLDVVELGEKLRLHFRTFSGAWAAPLELALPAAASGAPLVEDWDLDGTLDVVFPAGEGIAGVLAAGFDVRLPFRLALQGAGALRAIDLADVDGDHDFDLLALGDEGLFVSLAPGSGRGIGLDLLGRKSVQRGTGAGVEVRAGGMYRRLSWRGRPELIGLGGAAKLDVVRVTWPDGVFQTLLDLEAGASYLIEQRSGVIESCPFLYAWNGKTYTFISDVIGITPLGLPMKPGMLVPPDHDEYVLVRGDQLVPKDGFYELQLTEELREVTYLDRVRLDVVDHPAGTEVFPNERFTFPPFPEAHTHTVRAPLSPLTARDGDGGDWTSALAANDGALASPFQPLRGQYQGLATPHYLELAFDPEAVRGARQLRLLLNGWLVWTDASVNMAVARDPGHAFVPPLLQVPDGAGGWRDTGPPLGFPAGKLKTMVVDVTERLVPGDARLRLFSTLQIYWDSIRLAVDDDDAELHVTALEPASANLWERGFSRPIPLHGPAALDWFEWDERETEARWNQHPGLYTRYGECVELLGAIDDRFVLMGSGDALTLRFDAASVPPLRAGFVRDYLVFLDGWAKDRNPNTHEALFVEPLPFHGMSGYPYGPEERFPDDELHRAWRREWNTRPAKRWIEPLAPNERLGGSLQPRGAPPVLRATARASEASAPRSGAGSGE